MRQSTNNLTKIVDYHNNNNNNNNDNNAHGDDYCYDDNDIDNNIIV